jgi:hypothetical protein
VYDFIILIVMNKSQVIGAAKGAVLSQMEIPASGELCASTPYTQSILIVL